MKLTYSLLSVAVVMLLLLGSADLSAQGGGSSGAGEGCASCATIAKEAESAATAEYNACVNRDGWFCEVILLATRLAIAYQKSNCEINCQLIVTWVPPVVRFDDARV